MSTKSLLLVVGLLGLASLAPASASAEDASSEVRHRYLIERTFPAGALDGLDAAGKLQVNAKNAELGVTWIRSYANAEKTKTFCIYEGPSEEAIRAAAASNAIPVDSVTEIPVDLDPGPMPEENHPNER